MSDREGKGEDGAERGGKLGRPHVPGAERMSREVGGAAIKGKATPAAAERGNAAVAILEIEQPFDTPCRGGWCGGVGGAVEVGGGGYS